MGMGVGFVWGFDCLRTYRQAGTHHLHTHNTDPSPSYAPLPIQRLLGPARAVHRRGGRRAPLHLHRGLGGRERQGRLGEEALRGEGLRHGVELEEGELDEVVGLRRVRGELDDGLFWDWGCGGWRVERGGVVDQRSTAAHISIHPQTTHQPNMHRTLSATRQTRFMVHVIRTRLLSSALGGGGARGARSRGRRAADRYAATRGWRCWRRRARFRRVVR